MYYMIILDFLPDNTARVYYWNNEIGLVDSASDATKYPTADDCQGQIRVEMSRLGATYALDEQTINQAKKQLMTRLNQQYNIRG